MEWLWLQSWANPSPDSLLIVNFRRKGRDRQGFCPADLLE
jgi:hypothetical protein